MSKNQSSLTRESTLKKGFCSELLQFNSIYSTSFKLGIQSLERPKNTACCSQTFCQAQSMSFKNSPPGLHTGSLNKNALPYQVCTFQSGSLTNRQPKNKCRKPEVTFSCSRFVQFQWIFNIRFQFMMAWRDELSCKISIQVKLILAYIRTNH